jgi:hypothetical protein
MGGVWSDVHLLHVASISYPIQFEVQDSQAFTNELNHTFNAQQLKSVTIFLTQCTSKHSYVNFYQVLFHIICIVMLYAPKITQMKIT